MKSEQAFTMWEVMMSLVLLLAWSLIVIPFVLSGHDQVQRLQGTLHDYERLQVEVLHATGENTGGAQERCLGSACLPTR